GEIEVGMDVRVGVGEVPQVQPSGDNPKRAKNPDNADPASSLPEASGTYKTGREYNERQSESGDHQADTPPRCVAGRRALIRSYCRRDRPNAARMRRSARLLRSEQLAPGMVTSSAGVS